MTEARARFLAHQANRLLINFLFSTKCLVLSKEESKIFFTLVGATLYKFAHANMSVDSVDDAITKLTEFDSDMYKKEGFL